jgi:lipopolysaccharide assembly protein A
MNKLIWLLKWILKAAIFFTLFAFALNNQQEVTVHFFFGTRWHAPQVLVVLIVFAIGVAVGALGMVPRWWRNSRAEARAVAPQKEAEPLNTSQTATFPAIHEL